MILNLKKVIPVCNKEKCFSEYKSVFGNSPFGDFVENAEDICFEKQKTNGYKSEFECSNSFRLFFDVLPEQIMNYKTGSHYIYELSDHIGHRFKAILDKFNVAEDYIQCTKYCADFSLMASGPVDLMCILDYDRLNGIEKLYQRGFDVFPSFHETNIEVIERKKDNLWLRFSGGFHPIVTDVKMTGVFKEEYQMEKDEDPYLYFTNEGCVGDVEFQTINDIFIVKISDNYTSGELIGWYPEISFNEIKELQKNPENIKTKNFINEYIIYCSEISLDF